MMNAFFRRGFGEYRRQIDLKKSFWRQTVRIQKIIGAACGGATAEKSELHRKSRLLLAPLIEIAWADGRVTRREMDAILKAAAAYGLVDNIAGYRELTERLLSRPSPGAVGRMWQDFRCFLERLSPPERQAIVAAVLTQARFVAEQSSDSVIAFLRGERVCPVEREALHLVAAQLEKAKKAAAEADRQRESAARLEREKMQNIYAAVEMEIFRARSQELFDNEENDFEKSATATMREAETEDLDKLIALVPLVKVAWAEGRITRRERELIFAAARNMGVEPGSRLHERLSEWFERHPTEEFYAESLERLCDKFKELPEEERMLRRLDLLSDCVNVAEASGGTSRFPAGGSRICDEERAAVKRIAGKLHGAGEKSAALAA